MEEVGEEHHQVGEEEYSKMVEGAVGYQRIAAREHPDQDQSIREERRDQEELPYFAEEDSQRRIQEQSSHRIQLRPEDKQEELVVPREQRFQIHLKDQ